LGKDDKGSIQSISGGFEMTKVSVILPVYDAKPSFLTKSIQSIINQTFKDWELIIVLDHSPAKIKRLTQTFLTNPKIKIVENKFNLGLTKSVNRAVQTAHGKYIARMDADDIALPQRLWVQYEFMEANKNVQLCGALVVLIDSKEKELGVKMFPLSWHALKINIFQYNPVIHPTWFFRKKFWEKAKGFNEKFKYAQDHEFLLRTIKSNSIVNVNEVLLKYRVNDKDAISIKKLKSQQLFSLKARLYHVKRYGFSLKNIVSIIRAMFSLLIPKKINLLIYKLFFWR